MSAPLPGDFPGALPPAPVNLEEQRLIAARRRLALAQIARTNATREEIEARGIRPDTQQIVKHMNRVPSHSFKRTKVGFATTHKIYEDEDDDEEGGGNDDSDEEAKKEREENEFEEQWQGILAEEDLHDANMFVLAEFRQIARRRLRTLKKTTAQWRSLCRRPKKDRFDLIASLCSCTEMIVEVCKHLRPLDIVRLYSISKDFHLTINKNMRSSIFAWVSHMAPNGGRIYSSPVYCRWFIPDPDGRLVTAADIELSRTQPGQAKVEGQPPLNGTEGQVRLIPGLLWLQMAVNREIRVRDIVACLARRGHRLPEGATKPLLKIWLLMDAATSQARMTLLNNPDFFTNEDLYTAQLFIVKLLLVFNDPVFGPQSSMLMRLMLGQRGLSPLWALLRGKKYRSTTEIRQLKLRYDVGPEQIINLGNSAALLGLNIDQLGVLHFEGWGAGPDHLMRPDELIPLEAARRQLDLDNCIDEMMIFGHVDFATGNSLVPSLDEMYMSDDEMPPAFAGWTALKHDPIHSGCGNVPFEPGMWLPKHARKARWKTLTEEERDMILEAEQDEMDQIKDLHRARYRFDIAWANLANLSSQVMATKRLGATFKLLVPSDADLAEDLAQFAHPRPLRLGSPDAMDIDTDASPSSSGPVPFANLPFRPAPAPPQQQQQQVPLDPDDLSNIPDDDLALDPIPAPELRRLFHSFRSRSHHRPQSESSSSSHPEDEDDVDNNYNYTYQTHPQGPPTEPTAEPTGDTTESDPSTYAPSDASTTHDPDAPTSLPPLPVPYPYIVDPTMRINPTPATTLSEGGGTGTDEMLLAQADLAYSDFDENGDNDDGVDDSRASQGGLDGGEEGQGEGDSLVGSEGSEHSMMGVGALFDVDWDHFLRHPTA
ncbi:hypothetical protein C8A05DRAFT_30836, partial [Staphylotrichum tortipilum]